MVRKPPGNWESATEPVRPEEEDPEDGPTLQVFVPSHGPARVLTYDTDDLVETTEQSLPSFDELTGSGFYETITKPRPKDQAWQDETRTLERDELDEAQTLRRPPRLPAPRPLPSFGSAPAWAPPLKTEPFPLIPPPSVPFPLLERPPLPPAPSRPPPPDDPIIEIAPELSVDRSEAPFASAPPPPAIEPPRRPMPTAPPPPFWDPRRVPTPLRLASDRTALSAAVGVFAALALVGVIGALVFVISHRESEPSPKSAPRATTSASLPAAAPAVVNCRLAQLPRRLAPAIAPDVPPEVATAPGDKIAVGFAASANEAVGLIVNLDDLSSETRLRRQESARVLRVTPLPHRAPVTFAVDGPDARVQGARTIGARTPFRLGATPAGIVRVDTGREPSVVWPGPPGTLSFVTSAGLDGSGTAIALGRGGARGDIVFGWLADNGARATDLGRLDVGARRLGPPSMGVSDDGVLTVFAARGEGEAWSLFAALAKPGKLPLTTVRLEPGDAPADRQWPSVVALPSGGFMLSWLEGPADNLRLRARPLDRKLRVAGPIVEVANDAGLQLARGGLAVRHGRMLSLHTVREPGGATELWGALLTCS